MLLHVGNYVKVKHQLYGLLHLIFLSGIRQDSHRLFAAALDLGRRLLDFMSGTVERRNPGTLWMSGSILDKAGKITHTLGEMISIE